MLKRHFQHQNCFGELLKVYQLESSLMDTNVGLVKMLSFIFLGILNDGYFLFQVLMKSGKSTSLM